MPVCTVLDTLPRPPCAELLGWRVLDARPDEGWIRVGFCARPEFRNPAGFVQGGFLAAMLDETIGPAVFVMTGGRLFSPTIDMTVSFLAPAVPGPLVGEGKVIQLGKSVGFVEARLAAPDGTLVAKASATVRLVDAEKALG